MKTFLLGVLLAVLLVPLAGCHWHHFRHHRGGHHYRYHPYAYHGYHGADEQGSKFEG